MLIDIQEIYKRIAYARVRFGLQEPYKALGIILYGLPPIVHRPEKIIISPRGRELQVEDKGLGPCRTKKEALDRYGDIVRAEAKAAGFPQALGCAFAWIESRFDPTAYRYEPNFDRYYIHQSRRIDIGSKLYAPYAEKGITIDEWFDQNPRRARRERREGRNYKHFAQTRIAASFGIVQVMYPTSIMEGFREHPEAMYDPANGLRIGFKHLNRKKRRYKKREHYIAAYNAGSLRKTKDGKIKNQIYIDKILKAEAEFKKILRYR